MEQSAGRLLRAKDRALKYCLLFIAIRTILQLGSPTKPEKKPHDSTKGLSCNEEVLSRVLWKNDGAEYDHNTLYVFRKFRNVNKQIHLLLIL